MLATKQQVVTQLSSEKHILAVQRKWHFASSVWLSGRLLRFLILHFPPGAPLNDA